MTRQPRSTPSCTKRNAAGQPPTASNTRRGIATAPSQTCATSLLRPRSPTRSRGTHSRAAGPDPRGSTRSCRRPRRGSAANFCATRANASGRARLASSSRKNSSSPRTCGTPKLRPAGMPSSVFRSIPRTPSGSPVGAQPLPTTTTSRSTPSCSSRDSSPRRRSSGRLPCVRTTQPTLGAKPGSLLPGGGLGDALRALVDVARPERPDRVEHLVVHLRAGERVRPRRGGDLGLHPGRVLEQQHVVAVLLLGQQRLELVDGLLRGAGLVLDLDAAVLERVHGLAQVGRVARRIDAVVVPVGRVVARGRRVRLVV